ncbi:membrane protein FxsA [Vibrio fluvialis]|uniref:FxsA family protein n=1 Tax=Vibrio TaxID=662 RepID=UPI000C226A0C|nr:MULTISPECIES: FxsA family protein [Vibrio]HDM8036314.1 membrane protein FxsA [Vibrio fluvialis clinical-1]EKO3374006.1 membrane protein FxsA [Vibrio fluvialis]EKO3381222.1 membrane protein FxsA [Vibrio fluvialis]EKO3386918.1 membrane protein FxsA [Vibrio fluvialis]EKO3413328.1 membrane protein FxsA [Vibrio fluvialis]
MFPILLILFIAVPVIEIGLFIQVGGVLGLWPTIALVLITAFVGASLVRSQGLHTLMTVQQRMQNGEIPAQQIVEGVMLAVAGVLLLTPGFMTDAMGMLILLPAPRAMLAKYLMSKVVVTNMSSGFQSSQFERDFHSHSSQQHGQTFDGEFERKQDDDQDKLNRP